MSKVLLILVAITALYLMKFSLQSEAHTVLLVVVVAGLVYWLNRLRKRQIFKRHASVERPLTRIGGFEIQTMLDSTTPLECLQHDGLRYGESFRLKTAPPLPHNAQCTCKAIPLSYSSAEIFEGALRKNSMRQSAMGVLTAQEAMLLKEMLKGVSTQAPNDFETYSQQFDLGFLSEGKRAKMAELVQKKFDQIHHKSPVPS